MKKFLCACCVLALTLGTALAAAPKGWTDDFDAAQKKAAAENKFMYVLFTGSDWCPWCKKLKKTVLDSKEFKDLAKQSLVPVYLDFPRGRSVPMKQKILERKYSVRGYPTAFLMDANGRVIQQIRSRPDQREPYIQELQTLIRQNKQD